jgi:hypothetical protein
MKVCGLLANGIAGMRLWTYHDSGFEIDNPLLRIDWTKGRYWDLTEAGFTYRDSLPALHELVKEKNFLWCCTKFPNTFNTKNHRQNRIEWELDIPLATVVAFIRSHIWETVLRPKGIDWRQLLPTAILPPTAHVNPGDVDIDALVRLPLAPRFVVQTRRVPTVK